MANDIQDKVGRILGSDTARQILGTAVNEGLKGFGNARSNGSGRSIRGRSKKGMSGMRGLAAGAGAAAVAPLAAKGIGKLIRGNGTGGLAEGPKKLAGGAASKLGDSVGDKVTGKIDEAGGPSGILKDTLKSALPFGGDDKDDGKSKGGLPGVGKGRRMPVQQSVDIGLPIETVYNQWTQFEEWPNFMHRVTRVTQEDPCTVSFATKIWGKTKEFEAKIETQRPEERIKWRVSDGMTHTGVVTFHELGPRLTRVELGFDVDPGSMIEKAARGMRHVKRAARADLHRFKAFIEMLENETGAWRGVIEDGELVKDHDSSYDKKREYGSVEDLRPESEDEDSDEEQPRRGRTSSRNGGDPGRRSSRGGSSGGRRASGGRDQGGSSRRTQAKSKSSSSSSGAQRTRSSRSSSRSSGGGSSRSGSSRSTSNGSGSSRSSSRSHDGRRRTGSSRRS